MDDWLRVVVVEGGREISSKPYLTWREANKEFERLEKKHENNPKIDVHLWVREC